MRNLTLTSLAFLCLALGGQQAKSQSTISDLPPQFFAAQRGRAVGRPHGGFRLRYGRGLTPEGAGVLTTAIESAGPLITQVVGLMAPPADPSAAAFAPPQAQAVCRPFTDDPTLDSLSETAAHRTRLNSLDQMSDRMNKLVTCLGGVPKLPPAEKKSDDRGPVPVVGGGIIDPPAAAPGPAILPPPVALDCGSPENPAVTDPQPSGNGSGSGEATKPDNRPTPKQILQKLRDVNAELASGNSLAEALVKLQLDEATYRRWYRRFGDILKEEAERLDTLQRENAQLKKQLEDAQPTD